VDFEALEQLLTARFAGFVAEHTPPLETHPDQLAELRADASASGWQALVERGAIAVLTPREAGGLELGHLAVTVVAELMGTAGFPAARYLDTLLGLELLRRCPPSDEIASLVADVEAGRRGIAVAYRDAAAGRAPDEVPSWSAVSGGQGQDPALVSGRRSFVTDADLADTLVVLGGTAPNLVLLPLDDPSVLIEERSTLGRRRLLDVDVLDARIPRAQVVEFATAPVWAEVLGHARIWQAAYLTGLAAGALDGAVGYAKNRRQFGQPLARFQSIAFRLAASSARVQAARLLVRDVARRADEGEDVGHPAAQALALAADVARGTTAEGVHVHGAFGMTLQSAAQRFFRDAGTESVWLGTVPELRRRVEREDGRENHLASMTTMESPR
jgi:alkylation response protein AidB-like acyl-CoA dehydrogenase